MLYQLQKTNTFGSLKRGGVPDLPLLRTLWAICQKPSFWDVINSFVLVACASFAASRTLLQWLLASLNFTLNSEKIYSVATNEKIDFCEPWQYQQHKQLKTMEMSEVWPDTYHINSNLNPLTKFTISSRITKFKSILLWNISQMLTKTIEISTRIVISNAMKWGILVWVCLKVNGNWDSNIIRIPLWKESHGRTNTSIKRNKSIQKSKSMRVTVRDPSRKVNHLSKVIWDRKIITVLQVY